MSTMRLWYKKLGLELLKPLQDHPHQTRGPPMGEETKYKGEKYPIKLLLKEALER